MFHSFFPQPKKFFLSALAWTIVAIGLWYFAVKDLGAYLGIQTPAEPPVGAAYFVTADQMWFNLFFLVCCLAFGCAWKLYDGSHRWFNWSVWGSQLIVFLTYFGVQISLAVNNWRRPFWDLVQSALDHKPGIVAWDFYSLLLSFCQIGAIGVASVILTRFFASHYVFRWRTAMNEYYTSRWQELRGIEGASQRVQEDTMRFAQITEGLGISLIDSVMTLIAFLPLLFGLSQYVPELPIIGAVPHALFWLALFWSVFGTGLLMVAGIRLPGLYFKNQRVEAAYRKELVYGEDDTGRAEPQTLKQLYDNVRVNYFRMYYNYLYFNGISALYGQADAIFVYFFLIPTFVAGTITFGLLQQILTAFGQVSNSFQYLVNQWSTIIELQSIHKRLKAFEAAIDDKPLPEIDAEFIAAGGNEELA
ncbi:peptide antibiotic transporter SbmA [Sinorhizobium sp. BG8]|uniref:peptide antibiotic transporter SbmA n=1 Tax=Sinorhizobium sp. BG8 TaxID=2613773 RepID=UPI00193D0764|nr:peptide antibiotic transporter SbmA [Sinorhizobium sp. BG8]QRM56355.1 peptide antibiotic transporter SbmA [Sinorhizobium sp. BG8]